MSGEWPEEVTQIRALPFMGAHRVLVADTDLLRRTWLRNALAGHYGVEEVDTGKAAFERLQTSRPRVLIVGPRIGDMPGGVLLGHAAKHKLLAPQLGRPATFLIADTADGGAAVDEEEVQVFYRLTPELQPERVRELIAQAIAQLPRQDAEAPTEADAIRTRQILEHAKRLGAQHELAGAATAAIAAVTDLTGADRARCLYYDHESSTLWAEGEGDGSEVRASLGVAGLAVRLKSAIVLPHAADDPAYRTEVDDPAGSGRERLAVQPVADKTGVVQAVLIAVRSTDHPPFADAELKKLEGLAEAWAPYVHQLARSAEAAHVLDQRGGSDDGEMFRQEAIVNLVRRGHHGDVVRVHPGWVRGAYWAVVASLAAAIAYVALARIHQYAEGPAVVRITGRTEVTANDGGTITALGVAPGQTVTAGQALAQLHDTEQAGRLRGLEAEFERKLVSYLQSPADPGVREALASLVSEKESALAGVESRVIRAPVDGVVKEVLVRNGQRIEPGKTVLSIGAKGAAEGLSVLAFLPGTERPRLRADQRLRLTLPGYRGAYLEMPVRGVSTEVLGPAEARARFLGDRLGDTLPINGPVVVVEARLATTTFSADGVTYALHDGMAGRAEVQLSSRSVLETLIPGLAK
jgi:membrane fusion protein (multidrug efflux system)